MAENSRPYSDPRLGAARMPAIRGWQTSGPSFVQDCRKRLLCRFGLEAAQHVVGAEFDDQRVSVRWHRPVVSREPVRRRIARHARIEDLDIPTLGAKRGLQAIRKGLASRQAEAGGQAVSEDDEPDRPGRGGRSRRENRRQYRCLDEAEPMTI